MYPSYPLHDEFTYVLIVSPELSTLVTWVWIWKSIHTLYLGPCFHALTWHWSSHLEPGITTQLPEPQHDTDSFCRKNILDAIAGDDRRSSEILMPEHEVKCWQLDGVEEETWRVSWSNNEVGIADSHLSGFISPHSSHLAQTKWVCAPPWVPALVKTHWPAFVERECSTGPGWFGIFWEKYSSPSTLSMRSWPQMSWKPFLWGRLLQLQNCCYTLLWIVINCRGGANYLLKSLRVFSWTKQTISRHVN